MKFLVDENLPAAVAELLNARGHDARTISGDLQLRGIKDPQVMKIADDEDRILITMDHDFMNVQQYPPQKHPGIIVMHCQLHSKASMLQYVDQVLDFIENEQKSPRHQLWIVSGTLTKDVSEVESFTVRIYDPAIHPRSELAV